MNCVEREKKRPDAREPNLLELCVIPLADVEFVCWENTKHPNCQNNKKYCHSCLGFLIIYSRFHYMFDGLVVFREIVYNDILLFMIVIEVTDLLL